MVAVIEKSRTRGMSNQRDRSIRPLRSSAPSVVNSEFWPTRHSGGAIQSNSRIYTTYDANYNVTALVGYNSTAQTWGVVERFVYSPYGTVTVLSANWTAQSDASNWQYMYQGGRIDPITGPYHFDHRDYSASLGRFISQDPLQFINGANTYQFVMGNPVGNVDPSGLVSNSMLPPPGGSAAQQQAWLNRLTASAGGLPDGASLLPGNMSSGAPVWISVNFVSMFGQDLFGSGAQIHIVDPQFVAAQLEDSTFKNMLANFEAKLKTALRNASKDLAPGKSIVVPFTAKHQGYNMPEPYFLGFGTVYADITANITLSKDRTGHVAYSGNLNFHGYDMYQWGTLIGGNPIASAFGSAMNLLGTNYPTYWDWQMPFGGSW